MPSDTARVEALLRPCFQHFDGEHNEGHTPSFIVSPLLPAAFPFSEPDGAPLSAEIGEGWGQKHTWQRGQSLRPSALDCSITSPPSNSLKCLRQAEGSMNVFFFLVQFNLYHTSFFKELL